MTGSQIHLVSEAPLPASMEALPSKIDVKDLRFYYAPGIDPSLKGVSLAFPAGKVTAIIGPSGCGKSTLLRCLNRMFDLYPSQHATGEIRLDGENILHPDTNLGVLRSKVGMVFQKPTPFALSIYDNIAMAVGHYERLSRADMNHRVEGALRRAALWNEVKDSLHRSALGLSGGQQQRLCIARTIAIRPEVILMDEPTSALDPIATARIEELLLELESDYTVVIVTHNLHQAARIADYVALMHLGSLVEFGPVDDIMQRPQDPRTKDYLSGRYG